MSNVADRLANQRNTKAAATSKQVRLRLVYIDFWSALKLSFLVCLTLAIAMVVMMALVWQVLNMMGAIDQVSSLLGDLMGESGQDLLVWLQFGPLMMFTFVAAGVLIVFGSALGAVASLLYNVSVKITGGLLVGFTNN